MSRPIRSRNYADKKLFFDMERKSGNKKMLSARHQATEFLDSAARVGKNMTDSEVVMLTRARDTGRIAKKTTDAEILNYAIKVGRHQQAMTILDNPPSNAAYGYFSQQIKNAEHEKGARYTEKYGNISGLKKTKQRANNTRLSGEEVLHGIRNDDEGMEAALLASREEHENERSIGWFNEADIRSAIAESSKMPSTPSVSTAIGAAAGQSAETHADVTEVRDIAVLKIVSAKDAEDAESHQMVLEQLTRSKDKPYDQQAINSNRALVRAGQDESQRAESLAKIAGIRKGIRKRTGK
jgi:hypothetical protein